MRKEIQQLIDKLEEPIGLVYYRGIPICHMSHEELSILCTWLVQEFYKKDGDAYNAKT